MGLFDFVVNFILFHRIVAPGSAVITGLMVLFTMKFLYISETLPKLSLTTSHILYVHFSLNDISAFLLLSKLCSIFTLFDHIFRSYVNLSKLFDTSISKLLPASKIYCEDSCRACVAVAVYCAIGSVDSTISFVCSILLLPYSS